MINDHVDLINYLACKIMINPDQPDYEIPN